LLNLAVVILTTIVKLVKGYSTKINWTNTRTIDYKANVVACFSKFKFRITVPIRMQEILIKRRELVKP